MNLKNRKGTVLIICYFVIVILLVLGSVLLFRSVNEKRFVERERDSIQAFYLAEAGIDWAINELRKTVTKSFQNGVEPAADYSKTKDTEINEQNPVANYTGSALLVVNGTIGARSWGLIKWEWDAEDIPAGSIVTGAEITIYIEDPGDAYNFYGLKRDWVESEATWSIYSTGAGNNWEVAGGEGANDKGNTVLGVTPLGVTGSRVITLNSDGIAEIQGWVDAGTGNNYGFHLSSTGADSMQFASSETSTADNRPKLTINYQYATPDSVSGVSLGEGQYSVLVTQIDDKRKITATGSIPTTAAPRVARVLEAYVKMVGSSIPSSFFDKVLYISNKLELGGNYLITGDIIYGGTFEPQGAPGEINGETPEYSDEADPLPLLNFVQLRQLSAGQNANDFLRGNVYDQDRLDDDFLPTSFWYDAPDNTIPNIVYIEADLKLEGSFGTIGGFLIIVGDVLTDSDAFGETEIKGTGTIEGAIYTNGKFEVEGNADTAGIVINGGVWVGGEAGAEVKGKTTITYDQNYMATAIGGLGLSGDVQLISWQQVF